MQSEAAVPWFTLICRPYVMLVIIEVSQQILYLEYYVQLTGIQVNSEIGVVYDNTFRYSVPVLQLL